MNGANSEFQSLMCAILDGTVNNAQTERMATLLRADPPLRSEYVKQMRLDAALRFTNGAAARPTSIRAPKVIRFPLARIAWAAAAVVVAMGLFFVFGTSRGVRVEIVSARDGAPPEFVAGGKMRLHSLKLIRGNVSMRLSSGVLLEVAAPAEMHLADAMHVRVVAGRITADVGEHGKGFVIETPQTRIVDLGTRFGVDASDAAHTDVVVFQGQVELYQSTQKERVALLNAGDAVRVSNIKRLSRIVSITGDGRSNEWSASGAQPAGTMISSVQDNLSGDYPSLHNFYRIAPRSLREGTQAYADTADEWRDIPASITGADLVQTFHADRMNWWLKVTINMVRPGVIFVFADDRTPIPAWLQEQFTNTGATITLAEISRTRPGQTVNTLTFSVWKRDVPAAGEITLGPPYADPPADRKSFRPSRMYGIAARPLPH